jgi:hypothetical protein
MVEVLPEAWSERALQFLDRSLLNAAHRSEAIEQRPRAPGTDARHGQEL